jgi:DNA polymerase III subunit epsilon
MYLFLDTETTGFPKKYGPNVQDGQARVCQIAMLLTDSVGKSLSEFSCLIRPDGWTVGAEAGAVHGFTNDLCEKYGVSGAAVLSFYMAMAQKAETIIAFNSEFDKKMMEIEADYRSQKYAETKWHCAMLEASPICNLPPTAKMVAAGYTKNKPPNLKEALKIICNMELGDMAHDALWDVRATKDIFFKLRSQEKAA